MRTWDINIFRHKGLDISWVQENQSCSNKKGIIRGLHFQLPPYSETKLVRCIQGEILDVFLDLRKGSATFSRWGSMKLSSDNKRMLLIPRGFAHGFCTLSPRCEVIYKVDNYYNKEAECGIIWNDPDIQIDWPDKDPYLSPKDNSNLTFSEFLDKYQYIDV